MFVTQLHAMLKNAAVTEQFLASVLCDVAGLMDMDN